MIQEETYPLIELMEKAVIVSAFMLVLIMLVLIMCYVYVIEPLLKAKHRYDRAEAIKRLEHQEFLQYKFDNQYNLESTRVGEEVEQLKEIKKEVLQ